jgi:hypothetical protein
VAAAVPLRELMNRGVQIVQKVQAVQIVLNDWNYLNDLNEKRSA